MVIHHIDMVILHIDMVYGLMMREMTVSMRSFSISICDILSLCLQSVVLQRLGVEQVGLVAE